jgi:hypothetical protein
MKKTILVLLALTSFAFAGTKRYDVTFGSPAVLNGMEVESGQYQLSFDGSKVTLVNSNSHKSFETTASAVQSSAKKYSETIVQSKHVNGKDLVNEIQIGGTKTALDFDNK